jgi:hypothetical protein
MDTEWLSNEYIIKLYILRYKYEPHRNLVPHPHPTCNWTSVMTFTLRERGEHRGHQRLGRGRHLGGKASGLAQGPGPSRA